MPPMVISQSLNRIVSLDEIKQRLGQIDTHHALQVATSTSSRQLWFPQSDKLLAYVNLINVSHLAKAVTLYTTANGRPMNLSDSDNDFQWLLLALNSMQWHSQAELKADLDEAMISYIIRQMYVTNTVAEHPVSAIARAYAMFFEFLPQINRNRVDIDAAMNAVAGVNCHELWVFCAAIHSFYYLECAKRGGPWLFSADFFADSPKRQELTALLNRVLQHIAKTPNEIRELSARRKYHDPGLPQEYWMSEFNILRDYPVVRLSDNTYCCPFPIFAWMRGSVGYYFDLVNYYAEIERKQHPKNPNPLDNIMSQVLGEVFQEYVGQHLASLALAESRLKREYVYKIGDNELRTPDWLLLREPNLPVLFECKARRPALPLQTRCRETDRDAEIESVISRSLGQISVFLKNAVAGKVQGFTPAGDWRIVYALVLYDLFPYHALPDIRSKIESIAERLNPDWRQFRSHVSFVPLSIQELEVAVQIEKEQGLRIEQQFEQYAAYRNTAKRVEGDPARFEFAKHFMDYAFSKWGKPKNAVGDVCMRYWNKFCEMTFQNLYGENLSEYEARNRKKWIQEAAYFRWLNGGRLGGQALNHWFDSEREYDDFERKHGVPPDMAVRLDLNYAITKQLERAEGQEGS